MPTKATLVSAIKNDHLVRIPGLTEQLVSKHLSDLSATDKGHIHRNRKIIRSTRKNIVENDVHPEFDKSAPCEMYCYAALADYNKRAIYTDSTGRFPICAYDGSQYILLTYVYDANAFLVCLLRTGSKEDLTNLNKNVYRFLTDKKTKIKIACSGQ